AKVYPQLAMYSSTVNWKNLWVSTSLSLSPTKEITFSCQGSISQSGIFLCFAISYAAKLIIFVDELVVNIQSHSGYARHASAQACIQALKSKASMLITLMVQEGSLGCISIS